MKCHWCVCDRRVWSLSWWTACLSWNGSQITTRALALHWKSLLTAHKRALSLSKALEELEVGNIRVIGALKQEYIYSAYVINLEYPLLNLDIYIVHML